MPVSTLPGLRLPVSPLALGTMLYGSRISTPDAFSLLDAFVARGGNVLDTAYGYAGWLPDGAGCSERTIGSWLRQTGLRDQVLVATKGGQPDPVTRQPRCTLEFLDHDLHTSLDRLGLPRVDLYWFHRDNVEIPVGELLDWAEAQINAGHFDAIGASNWSNARLREAAAWSRRRGQPGIIASQIGWSLPESNPTAIADPTLVHLSPPDYPDYVDLNLPIFAYQAQARGIFDPAKRQDASRMARYDTPTTRARLSEVDAMAATRGVSPNQIALAWFWNHPFPAHPVIGARTLAQLHDALGAVEINLTHDEWQRLNQLET